MRRSLFLLTVEILRAKANSMIDFSTYHPKDAKHILVVELSGQLDTDSAETFFEKLETAIDEGHVNIIFDCKGLQHISSLGFGMMIRSHSRVQKDGGAVRFARLEGMIEEAFNIVGFHKLFDNYPTIDAAADSIGSAA